MKYIVTEEIESPSRVSKHFTAFDFFFVIVYGCVSLGLMQTVHSSLKAPFMVFSFIMAVFLTVRSSMNKKRRNYESLLLLLRKDSDVYRPVYGGGEDEEK